MKLNVLNLAVLAFSATVLTGCSTLGTDLTPRVMKTEPTLENMTEYGALYKGSYIDKADFLADGTLKALEDYNFVSESAPCTALNAEKHENRGVEHLYEGRLHGESFVFICRPHSKSTPNEHRLYMAGTRLECTGRTWNYSPAKSAGGPASKLDLMCIGRSGVGGKTTPVEALYKSARDKDQVAYNH